MCGDTVCAKAAARELLERHVLVRTRALDVAVAISVRDDVAADLQYGAGAVRALELRYISRMHEIRFQI